MVNSALSHLQGMVIRSYLEGVESYLEGVKGFKVILSSSIYSAYQTGSSFQILLMSLDHFIWKRKIKSPDFEVKKQKICERSFLMDEIERKDEKLTQQAKQFEVQNYL